MIRALDDIGDFLLWGSSALLAVFVIQYSVMADWWRNAIGITIAGEALCLLAIFVPSLLALADPAGFARFATQTWYLLLSVGVVFLTFAFTLTRVVTWERIRRQRPEDIQHEPAQAAKDEED